jgi:signal transduction histidine kinase
LSGQSLLLLAAAPETSNQVVLHNFLRGLLSSAPILLLISCAGGYWISRRALQPVDRITAKARSISISNLSERLPVTQTADELQRLTVTCNAMLDRLEASVSRIKQFTADASHELRGPLSFTRTVAEVALRTPEIDSNSRRAFSDIVDETAKASVLLDEMLMLARADSDSYDMAQDTVDLAVVIRDVYAKAAPIAASREVALITVLPGEHAVEVKGDFAHLRRLVWILLDNALKYTPASGQVEVSLTQQTGVVTVHVRDTGVGIAEVDLPHIFERFYRADPSRGMVEGNGLGLSIAKWIAEMHHAEISVQSALNTGTAFCLRFP